MDFLVPKRTSTPRGKKFARITHLFFLSSGPDFFSKSVGTSIEKNLYTYQINHFPGKYQFWAGLSWKSKPNVDLDTKRNYLKPKICVGNLRQYVANTLPTMGPNQLCNPRDAHDQLLSKWLLKFHVNKTIPNARSHTTKCPTDSQYAPSTHLPAQQKHHA